MTNQNDNIEKKPLYRQIAVELEARIRADVYDTARLPPERALGREFQVSVITIKQALNLLESKGLILRHPRRGTSIIYRKPPGIRSPRSRGERILRWLKLPGLSDDVHEPICRRFEQECPGWKLKISSESDFRNDLPGNLENAIAEADVYTMNAGWFNRILRAGHLAELDATLPGLSASSWFRAAKKSGEIGGRTFAYPQMFNPGLLYARIDVLQQYDIEPEQLALWSTLYPALRQIPLSEDHSLPRRFGFVHYEMLYWENFIFQAGGSIIDATSGACVLDHQKTIQGMSDAATMSAALDLRGIIDLSCGGLLRLSEPNHEVACFVGGPAFVKFLKNPKQWITLPFPAGRINTVGAASYLAAINNATPAEKQAAILLRLICGEFGQQQLTLSGAAMPALKHMAREHEAVRLAANLQSSFSQWESVQMAGPWIYHPVVRNVIRPAVERALAEGEPTVEELCRRLTQAFSLLNINPAELLLPAADKIRSQEMIQQRSRSKS